MKARWLGLVGVAMVVLAGCNEHSAPPPAQEKSVAAASEPAKADTNVAVLGFAPDDFVKSFNASVDRFFSMKSISSTEKSVKPLYVVKSHSVQDGPVQDIFNAASGMNQHRIFGGVRKESGLIRDLTVMLSLGQQGSADPNAVASDFMIVCRILVSATSSVRPEDSLAIVNRLIQGATTSAGAPVSETVGDVRYSATVFPEIGFAFMVQAAGS